MGKKSTYPEEFLPTTESLEQLDEIKKGKPTSICFFNNKGGVGKTTLLANLAAELAINYNAKILVVDADPQCNLSQYLLDDEDFLDTYGGESIGKSTIYDVVHPISIGKGYAEDLPIYSSPDFNVDVVLGDPRLAIKEDLLAQDWRDAKAGGVRGLRTTFIFHHLIKRAENYDFVFFDMGPSLGAINRSILIAADGFVVPMSIDIFSSWALKNIGSAVNLWKKELKIGMGLAEDPSELPFDKEVKLKFYGYVTQQHKEKKEASGKRRIVQAYNAINTRLPIVVKHSLENFYAYRAMDPHLGEIKHLASLAPRSQTEHMPMISIKAVGNYASLRKHARSVFSSISRRFIENIHGSL